ncbi:trehalose-6-phosphate synthase [Algimonas arctica]|uniref:Trehalose-6-phosphate synthase n=1 Tax=Algimonas arctica TaxID=1479486 RepID=A0A8J3CV39_9PROT|nr:trehalose-6-phosphate synthase [Algimonas arctica]GHB06028.1 trehalose-6-phosphate synthase [Algimonas arctica]
MTTPIADDVKGAKGKSPRLIAVSNRTAIDSNARAGGLAVALWDSLKATNGLWVGWSGKIKDFPSSKTTIASDDGVDFALYDMSKAQYEGFYLNYANSVLWPLFHSRLDLVNFDQSDFRHYQDTNKQFSKAVADHATPDDYVWVHDYHFILLADELRKLSWQGKIGFFLHIPFPPPETFRALPEAIILAKALTMYDIIGLQTTMGVTNLKRLLIEVCGGVDEGGEDILVHGRTITIRHCPIGIDAVAFKASAESPQAKMATKKLRKFLGDRKLIIGVDRMDYSKGLPQRFKSVAKLFDSFPHTHGVTSFMQIAPPSRAVVDEYQQLRKTLDGLCGRINGDYGDLDWIPIRYLARAYKREEIAGLYSISDVCLVTPLQDGMNLVAKEFIAAQDPDDPGVLILSQFAGAAEQMTEALIVNPYDTDKVAEMIARALDMPLAERKKRWKSLNHNVVVEDINWWRERFFAKALAPAKTIGFTT